MPDLQGLLDAVRAAYGTWGYPIVFLGALLENTALLGLLLPGGTLVLLGAVYAQEGEMSLAGVLLLGWLGMVCGTSLDYVLGRWGLNSALGGTRLVRRLRPGLDRAKPFLEHHGPWAFPLAHFVGHIRSFVAISAGASGLSYPRFLAYEAPAALLWNCVFVGAGFLVGENLAVLERILSRIGIGIVIVAVLAFGAYRLWKRRSGEQTDGLTLPAERRQDVPTEEDRRSAAG